MPLKQNLMESMFLISGFTPDDTVSLDCFGLYVGSNSGETRYGNHQISYSTTSMTKNLYFPGAEVTDTENDYDFIAVRSDLPTAISTSDLNTILV